MGGEHETVFTVYADISDLPIETDAEIVDELVVDEYSVNPDVTDETTFMEGQMTYTEFSAQRYENKNVLDRYDVELPEVYSLAETFVWRYPFITAATDILERRPRRRFRRELEEVLDVEDGEEQAAAIDAALDEINIGESMDMRKFRDRLTVDISTAYKIPIQGE